ncbi:WWOX-like protein [Mya arenaria]|uniref:WWOX-like protein n=1 Tax=Mya arenaria TaxID=6604 RepID=A0ABY7EHC8_MYAAR|nr:WWOX-like protein [Mya arenaria]
MGGQPSHVISPMPIGKTVIITGGNTGIGYEVAKGVAMLGAKVILAVRTEERGKSALAKMKADYEERKKGGDCYDIVVRDELDVQYHICDLTSLKSTMQFISWFKSTVLTEDQWESTYQVNYLAHFLMISEFLPAVCASDVECRIVIISSQNHMQAEFDPEYAASSRMKKFDGFNSYANCKLFQIQLMYSLDKVLEHHPHIDVLSVDRGKLDAMAFPNSDASSQGFSCQMSCLKCCGGMRDDRPGADTVIFAALDPALQGLSRGYFLRPRDKARPAPCIIL